MEEDYLNQWPIELLVRANSNYDLETREEFWNTLNDILARPVTMLCPEIEICE